MDNQIFKINGQKKEDLITAIKLAVKISCRNISSYKFNKKGFILYWIDSDNNSTKFPFKDNVELVAEIVWQWLQEIDDNSKFEYGQFEGNLKHDGHN